MPFSTPQHKQPAKPVTLAEALLRTEMEGTRAAWYQEYLNQQREVSK